jgi:hypothetical protein
VGIDQVLATRHNLQDRLLNAVDSWYIESDVKLLPDLLAEVLRAQARCSFGSQHEPDLRGIVELVMGTTCCGAAHRLIGPLDLFGTGVSRVRIRARDPANADKKGLGHWELRTLTLRGLWRAANPNDTEPSAEALRTLHEELVQDDEERLLARPYIEWSPVRNAAETVLVRSFVEPELDVPLFVAVGGAHVLTRRPAPC